MLKIDADSHMAEPIDWLEQMDPKLSREVDDRAPTELGERLLGELLESIPKEQRPPLSEILPPAQLAIMDQLTGMESTEERQKALKATGLEALFNPPGGAGGADRVKFCDERGIQIQLCLPTLGIPMISAARGVQRDLGLRVARTYNDWVAAATAGYTDRLIPVAYIPLDDIGFALAEMKRMKARGARAWIMPLNPIDGQTIGDRKYDPLWAASLELGMLPIVHQGMGWFSYDPAWAHTDGKFDSRKVISLVGLMIPALAQMALMSLIYGGVFDRFPKLVVLCEEFGMGWVDEWANRLGPMSRLGSPNFAAMFPWPHKSTPDEIIKRHIRFTPLRGQRVDELIDIFGDEVVLYASDYPHPEGIQVDWDFYDKQLRGRYSDESINKFYHGNMAKLLGLEVA